MAIFADNGQLFREQNDLFLESSWLQVMLGQGIEPKDYHPIADNFSPDKLREMLANIQAIKQEPLSKLPDHDTYIETMLSRS